MLRRHLGTTLVYVDSLDLEMMENEVQDYQLLAIWCGSTATFHMTPPGLPHFSQNSSACPLIGPDQKDWISKLPVIEFAMNSSTTGYTPFVLNYGHHQEKYTLSDRSGMSETV